MAGVPSSSPVNTDAAPVPDQGGTVVLLVGTTKGAFVFCADRGRMSWRCLGPLLPGWQIYDLTMLPTTGRLLAATNHQAYGPTVRVSDDFGAGWRPVQESPRFPDGGGRSVREIWRFGGPERGPGTRLYAGTADAGLFTSGDEGESWTLVESLDAHPTRPFWDVPATAGSLHSVVLDPADPRRMWVGVAGAGVFGSVDGGATWEPRNYGLPPAPPGHPHPEVGRHVHKLAIDPTPPHPLYLQHRGAVSTSTDGGHSWRPVPGRLPGAFGFPLAVDRHGALYVAPLAGPAERYMPDGRLGLYRSTDAGTTWTECRQGLPATPQYVSVLRDAVAVDDLDPVGVYFGTTSGELYASADGGDTWRRTPGQFTRVTSVRARVLDPGAATWFDAEALTDRLGAGTP
ncbi:hypothetical protein SAMN04489717_4133 [Actinopolymorpha singaporensis]|uniref:BNR/Asp-box repeat-containing protein n=1 Tax=Actinopolymorpha singaporensis TaxID=117157 RepID=A0A1H1VM92_9ACTN|nr:hypothetical protein SAMN04489717_4133 [Actinopolymorpha singaporensis]